MLYLLRMRRPRYACYVDVNSVLKSVGGSVTVMINRRHTKPETVRLYVVGAKAPSEDWGFGKDFDAAGTWINDGYQKNYIELSFENELQKYVTLQFLSNTNLSFTRNIKLFVKRGNTSVSASTQFSLVEDRFDYVVDVTNPGSPCGHNLSAYALDSTGQNDCGVNMRNLLSHFANSHDGAAVQFVFPPGIYRFASYDSGNRIIPLYLQNLRMSFIGQGDAFGTQRATLQMDIVPNWVRLFAPYNWYTTGDARRVWFHNLHLYGSVDLYNSTTRPSAYALEQCKMIMVFNNIAYNPVSFVTEYCLIDRTPSDGIMPYSNVEASLYWIHGYNCFRGLVVATGPKYIKIRGKHVHGSRPYDNYHLAQYDVSKLDFEINETSNKPVLDVYFEDCTFNGGMDFEVSNCSNSAVSTITCKRVNLTYDPAYGGRTKVSGIWDGTNGVQIFFEDCILQRLETVGYTETTNCQFVANTLGLYYATRCVPAIIANSAANAVLKVVNSNISYRELHPTIPNVGISFNASPVLMDVQFINISSDNPFVIGNSYSSNELGGIRYMIIDSPVVTSDNYLVRTSMHAIYSNIPLVLTVKQPIWQANGKFGYFSGSGGAYHDYAYIFCQNVTVPKSNNTISFKEGVSINGLRRINVYGVNPLQPTAMIPGSPTVITCPNHGLQTGDNIMFSGLLVADWADIVGLSNTNPVTVTWPNHGLTSGQVVLFKDIAQTGWTNLNLKEFTISNVTTNTFTISHDGSSYAPYNPDADPGKLGHLGWRNLLKPLTNVPLLTVTVIDSNSFSVPIDSTSLPNTWNPNADTMCRFFKLPVRLIIGESGDYPPEDKPAGFAGDLYKVGDTYYVCRTTGTVNNTTWEVYS